MIRNPFVTRVGGVLSADIAVPEHEREIAFYSAILTTGDSPLWREDLMNNLGTPIIGLGVRTPEYEELPLQWMPHFQVADIAESVARALELGANEIMHGKTDDGQSQWAVLTDPNGAAFGLIPVVEDESVYAQQKEPCGRIAWLSLVLQDALNSKTFYEQVIGWKATSIDASGGTAQGASFEMQIDDQTAAAEICQLSDEPENLPAVWLIHLPVQDFPESLSKVSANGGEVVKEYTEQQFAIIRDPVGVYFAIRAL